jgi:hypothetical protein
MLHDANKTKKQKSKPKNKKLAALLGDLHDNSVPRLRQTAAT